MFLALLKGVLTLLGLGNWAEKLWGKRELKEQGKEDLILEQTKETLDDAQKAKAFEDRVASSPAEFERMRELINQQK